MNFEYIDKNYKTVEVDESSRVILQDKDGNRYRVTADKFGGLEIMAEDGKLSVEPHMANVIIVKTID